MSSCLVVGFLLSMVLAGLLMVLSPLRLLLLFMPCVACTYMPNASWRRRGSKVQGRGLPTLAVEPGRNGKGRAQRRSAQAKRGRLGKPLHRARAAPLGILIWFTRKTRSKLTL